MPITSEDDPKQTGGNITTEDAPSPWDWTQQLGSSALAGYGPEATAAGSQVDPWLRAHFPGTMNALESGVNWMRAHQPFGGQTSAPTSSAAPAPDYETALQQARTAQAGWQAAHPYQNLAATSVGGAVPFIAGTALTGGGLEALGAPAIATRLLAPTITGTGIGATEGAHEAPEGQKLQGAIKGGLIGGGTALATGGIGELGGLPFLVRAPAGAVIGGGTGAGYGYATGQDPLKYGAYGASFGAGYAAGAPYLPAGAQIVANKIFQGRTGVNADAADATINALSKAGHTPADAAQVQADLGTGATLADTSEAARTTTSAPAADDLKAGAVIKDNLAQRAEQFEPRINAAIDQAAGPDFNAVDVMNSLKARTAAEGNAAYTPILNSGAKVDLSSAAAAIDAAQKETLAAGAKLSPTQQALGQARKLFAADPANTPISVADNAYKGIRSLANRAAAAGDTATAGALNDLRQQVRGLMPPEYQAAASQYADNKAIEEAFQNGRNILAPRQEGQVFDPDVLKANLAQMTPAEKDAFGYGVRKALTDVQGQAKNDAAGVMAKFANDNGYAANKLRAVWGGDRTDALLKHLDSVREMQATNAKAIGGSKTAEMQAAAEDLPKGKKVELGLSDVAGYELGGQVGKYAGMLVNQPELGEWAGKAVGFGAGKTIKPLIEQYSERSAQAARLGMADMLSRPSDGQNTVIEALQRRPNYLVEPQVTGGQQQVVNALTSGGLAPPQGRRALTAVIGR